MQLCAALKFLLQKSGVNKIAPLFCWPHWSNLANFPTFTTQNKNQSSAGALV
jgi:hypothetical protein